MEKGDQDPARKSGWIEMLCTPTSSARIRSRSQERVDRNLYVDQNTQGDGSRSQVRVDRNIAWICVQEPGLIPLARAGG